ncbi:Ger(x)C family spore germination protein [Pseudoneobacillus rhizosphaerae]|uniref:Spore germination protein B3 n=1 Tax=Pseudoneobacillus rhizosphaerae TaxID=2880968 RepID=A0A9C7GA41_9BACI|nr:Ger(x)C family spore germination protein [Pseudoneobacillus rhizosphaerae]CAG9608709.1 Spore germination protein B3 [Pseudoneobacillus rhizosphaerae]
MIKKILLLVMIGNCIVMLSGCWSSKEITELMIVTGMGIDRDSDTGEYKVTVQIINPGEIASQTKTERLEVTTYQTTGESIYEVMRRFSTKVPRRMYLAHIQLVIFGEELAKEGIGKTLDFISRNHEFRTDFFILVSKNGKAEEVLNVLTPTEASPSVSLYSSINVSEKIWAPTKGVHLDELLNTLVSEGKHPVLTGVEVRGDKERGDTVSSLEQIKPAAVTKITGFAAFRNDKLVGWLTENESKGYNYIINNIKSTVGSIPCEDSGIIALDVKKIKTDLKTNVKSGKPSITIKTNIEADLGEIQCDMDLSKTSVIKQIEEDAAKQVQSLMEHSITKAKEDLKSDIFGFGETIHRQHPKAWKKLKGNWDETFQDLEISFDMNYEIRRIGTISNSFQKVIK